MSEFSLSGYCFASFEEKKIYGKPGAGFYNLVFELEAEVGETRDGNEITVLDVRGIADVWANKKSHKIGHLYPSAMPIIIETKKEKDKKTFHLEVELDQRRMKIIEDLRNGGKISFHLTLFGIPFCSNYGYTNISPATINIEANQSEWIEVLEQMGYTKLMLLEVPVPQEISNPAMVAAVEYLKSGQKHFLQGNYRESVESCRDILESIAEALGEKGDPQVKELFKNTQEKNKEERIQILRRAMKVFTHAAKHANKSAAKINWYRDDAEMAIRITASLLSKYGSKK